MRELSYNWELNSYIAPDMTILVPEITGDGIVDTAFQQTPNSILWCIKDNGQIATFVYERKEQIASWSMQITDGDFESVAIITGDPENEVWVSVEREIDGNTKRYIEYFSDRDFGYDLDDAFYVDCGITYDSTATTTITGLDHLEGETVQVLGDGDVQTSQIVSGNQITIDSASTVQVGLPFTSQLKTMPLSWLESGISIQGRIKRINEVVAQYYNSGDFYLGQSVHASITDSQLNTIKGYDTNSNDIIDTLEILAAAADVTGGTLSESLYFVIEDLWAGSSSIDALGNEDLISITKMSSGISRITFPAGYNRFGYVVVYQRSPEPLTLLALMIEFMAY